MNQVPETHTYSLVFIFYQIYYTWQVFKTQFPESETRNFVSKWMFLFKKRLKLLFFALVALCVQFPFGYYAVVGENFSQMGKFLYFIVLAVDIYVTMRLVPGVLQEIAYNDYPDETDFSKVVPFQGSLRKLLGIDKSRN